MIEVLELPYAAVSVKDVVEGEVSEELIDAVLNSAVSLHVSVKETFYPDLKIVGITDGVQDRLVVTVNSETYGDMQVVRANVADIYLRDRTENMEKVERLLEQYGYAAKERLKRQETPKRKQSFVSGCFFYYFKYCSKRSSIAF